MYFNVIIHLEANIYCSLLKLMLTTKCALHLLTFNNVFKRVCVLLATYTVQSTHIIMTINNMLVFEAEFAVNH